MFLLKYLSPLSGSIATMFPPSMVSPSFIADTMAVPKELPTNSPSLHCILN